MTLRIDLDDLDAIAGTHAPHLLAGAPYDPGSRNYDLAVGATAQPIVPGSRAVALNAPDLPATVSGPAGIPTSGQPARPSLRVGRPEVTSEVGSPGFYREKIAQKEYEKEHPWGSPDNHPGFLGKVAHGLATAGNIAGSILAPEATSLIPGTTLNRNAAENNLEGKLGEAETRETAALGEKNREKHEQNIADVNAEKQKTANQKELDALAEHGLTRDEQGNVVPLPPEKLSAPARQKLEDSQKLDAYRKAQTDLAEANEELKRSQNDPNSPQFQMAMKKLQMAQLAHEIAAKNLGLHEQEFTNKVQEQGLVKPSGQASSRGSAAQAAIDVLPELEQQIRANAAELGPIFGRLAKGEIAIGDVPPNIAKLYSSLSSFYALNPAIHGFRNFEFVKDMPSFIGGLERDPESTIAGLEGLRPTLESVSKEGKTFHKRIVEGGDNAPPSATPPAAGSFADFQKSRKPQ